MDLESTTARCRAYSTARSGDPSHGVAHGSSYQIEVLGAAVEELVISAGGWLFDRMMAGWVVNVLLPEGTDSAPIQILGFKTICESMSQGRRPVRAMVAAADRIGADIGLRDIVGRALDSGQTQVTLWGAQAPQQLKHPATHGHYRLSGAARAFKAQALRAATGRHHTVPLTEFFVDYAGWCRSDGSDMFRIARSVPKRTNFGLDLEAADPDSRSAPRQ